MTAFPERALVQSATEVKAWEKGLGICHEDLSVNLREGPLQCRWGQELDYRQPQKEWWQSRVCGCRRKKLGQWVDRGCVGRDSTIKWRLTLLAVHTPEVRERKPWRMNNYRCWCWNNTGSRAGSHKHGESIGRANLAKDEGVHEGS